MKMLEWMKKKGQVNTGVIMSIVFVVIILAVIAIVLSVTQGILSDNANDYVTGAAGCNSTDKTACGYDYNSTKTGQENLNKVNNKMGMITTVVILVIILALLFGIFAYLRMRG